MDLFKPHANPLSIVQQGLPKVLNNIIGEFAGYSRCGCGLLVGSRLMHDECWWCIVQPEEDWMHFQWVVTGLSELVDFDEVGYEVVPGMPSWALKSELLAFSEYYEILIHFSDSHCVPPIILDQDFLKRRYYRASYDIVVSEMNLIFRWIMKVD